MRSLLSEFSYGFALTHELVKAMGTLTAAPIFPSLVEEGAAGGGYDVKLDKPGLPLYIQFKRSECLKLNTGREIKAGATLSRPYYRFAVTAAADSNQHEMLLDWDTSSNEVFYAAPMFHTKPEFDRAFLNDEVRQRSFFVRPRLIGRFSDDKPHYVSFDGSRCYVMSKPREIEAMGIADLEQLFRGKLSNEKRTLKEMLPETLQKAKAVRDDQRNRDAALSKDVTSDYPLRSGSQTSEEQTSIGEVIGGEIPEKVEEIAPAEAFFQLQRAAVPPAPVPNTKSDGEMAQLRELADISIRDFNAQLYIVRLPDATEAGANSVR